MKRRMDELYDVKLHDPYMDRNIYKDPTICPSCNLLYHNKRWFFDDELLEKYKDSAEMKKCPACRKIEDNYPLGILSLSGNYVTKTKELILNLINNEAEYEKKRNPLARIISIEEDSNKIVIKTTTESLARRLGRAVDKAHHGKIKYTFSEDQKLLRVEWSKD